MKPEEGYREAEGRIAEARESGSLNLNLSYLQLTKIPPQIAQLSQLKRLDLDNNQIVTIPDAITQLSNLQYLYLFNNQIVEIPDAIAQFSNLQILSLNNNKIVEIPDTITKLPNLQELWLGNNQIVEIPDAITKLPNLRILYLRNNQIVEIPDAIAQLSNLQYLYLNNNQIVEIPDAIAQLSQLKTLWLNNNQIVEIPDAITQLSNLQRLDLENNKIAEMPDAIAELSNLQKLILYDNPLNPTLVTVYQQGLPELQKYLRERAKSQITLNEGKLILVGEGEVGKSCLLGALRGDEWIEGRPTTHGIEIKACQLEHNATQITLNGWDFGGQPVYRPTHQLFFSAPAIYLVVWKPREGPQQGFVDYWITLIKRRAPEAKIIVVATHGGPNQRQPDIERQTLIDKFGQDILVNFFFVNSKPPDQTGIEELKNKIAEVAYHLKGVREKVPKKWEIAWKKLKKMNRAYLPYSEVITICKDVGLETDQAELLLETSHILGRLIHYHNDPTLKDIVILKPDWLAKAISFVLDDQETRTNKGLIEFERLRNLWQNPPYKDENDNPEPGYAENLHPIFLRLMERFDLSYRIKLNGELTETSLLAQLVPDNRPETLPNWETEADPADKQQIQICRIVDEQTGQQANAEGLFYQLIVRLHQYSLGRENYPESIHWQRGLMLGDRYNGRALLEHIRTDIKITVRAAYPERFLSRLTEEVESLFDPKNPARFWKGLRCQIMVPCIAPCQRPGQSLFNLEKLIESKHKGRPEFPCSLAGCDQWQNIDQLLYNAPIAQPDPLEILIEKFEQLQATLKLVRQDIRYKDSLDQKRYLDLNKNQEKILSLIDQQFDQLMQTLTDEAKEGPRLFSIIPVDPKFFDSPKWLKSKFQITLWCEHSRLPLTFLNPADSKLGIYEVEISRQWFTKAKPLIKTITTTLSLVLPVAASFNKFVLDENAYKTIEEQLDLGQKALESTFKTSELLTNQTDDKFDNLEVGNVIEAQGSVLRELHAILKEKDPNFTNLGLERVQNKRGKFLWVHPRFISEY
jgi:Leucine-rich repeat (LRR) protein